VKVILETSLLKKEEKIKPANFRNWRVLISLKLSASAPAGTAEDIALVPCRAHHGVKAGKHP
jgi:hypothetical protein